MKAFKELQDLQVHKAMWDQPVLPVQLVALAYKVFRDLPGQQEMKGRLGLRVRVLLAHKD